MSERIKGTLTVEIEEDNSRAHIRFVPKGAPRQMGEDYIEKILDENDVCVGIDDDRIYEMITALPKLTEEKLFTDIAVQIEPVQPVQETIELLVSGVPDELKPYVQQTLSQAPSPRITESRVEKVVIDEFAEEKKGIFSKLGKDKVREEEVVKKIRVQVDPEVLQHGFVQQGERLGIFRPASSGKPGQTVTQQPIPQEKIKVRKFLTGDNVVREGGDFIAQETGFFRLGENWIDIVPFRAHEWSFYLSNDKASCFLDFKPGISTIPVPSAETLDNQLEKLGYPREQMLPLRDILNAIKNAIETETSLEAYPVSLGADAIIEIEINPSETRADLFLRKGTGEGEPLDTKKIGPMLSACKIPRLDIPRIKQALAEFLKSQSMETRIMLAEGKPAKRGKDKEVVYEAEFLSDQDFHQITEFIQDHPEKVRGIPSLKDLPILKVDQMALVKKGSVLFRVTAGSAGENGLDIFGRKIPGYAGNEPIITLLENVTFEDGVAIAKVDGIADFRNEDNQYFARVRKHQDTEVSVSVSENNMNAFLTVYPPDGSGRPLSPEQIKGALADHGVIKGIREDQVVDAVDKAKKGEMVADFLIAEGKLPAGKESVLKLLVNIDPNKKNSVPIKKEDVFGEIFSYEKDDAIGFNVLGEKLEGEEGLDLEIGENVVQEDQGEKTLLKAEKSGRLFYDGKKVYIRDKLIVKGDVSLKNGNVKFPGSVIVEGSVLSRVSLVAGEDVKIAEVVQDALISTDGNIEIGRGIKGGRKAVIRAQGNIRLGFAEEANLLSVGDIQLGKALMLCNIKCNQKILSVDKNTKIIGGVIKSKGGLEIGSIGSERGAKTVISFGQDYLIENQIDVLTSELQKLRDYVVKVDDLMERMENSSNKKKLMEVRKKKLKTLKMIEKKNLRLFLLKEKFEMHSPSEVKVFGEIYPGVTFESHGRTLEINEIKKGLSIIFDPSNGRIQSRPL